MLVLGKEVERRLKKMSATSLSLPSTATHLVRIKDEAATSWNSLKESQQVRGLMRQITQNTGGDVKYVRDVSFASLNNHSSCKRKNAAATSWNSLMESAVWESPVNPPRGELNRSRRHYPRQWRAAARGHTGCPRVALSADAFIPIMDDLAKDRSRY